MSVIVYQFETVKFIQMMSLTFSLFTQVNGSGPLGPFVLLDCCTGISSAVICRHKQNNGDQCICRVKQSIEGR